MVSLPKPLMKPYRREQLSSLIQKELGELVIRNIEFPPGSLVTISEVEISRDSKRAAVWIGVIPGEMSGTVLGILEKARGSLQYELGETLRARIVPRIEFMIDRGAEHAALIEKISLEEKED